GTVDADRADRQRLPDRAELLRPHRPAVADRVGHQLQSGRTGEQRQLQPGSSGRRRSGRRQRRFLRLHAHSWLERPAGGRGVLAAARGPPGHAQGRAEADLVHAGRGRRNLRRRSHGAGRGPRSERKGPATGPVAPDTASPFLTAMLDGAPPAEAEPLAVSGVSPDDLRAWKVGNRVVLRTRFALISPEWLASQTGEGGVTVYSLPVTPIVLLSQDGRTI